MLSNTLYFLPLSLSWIANDRRGSRTILYPKKIQHPKRMEIVYLQLSPNYCEKDYSLGSLGTDGRTCNRTTREVDGCDLLCCGRGYNTHQINRTWQCRCKFQWCCNVQCDVCQERIEEYTCKWKSGPKWTSFRY